MIGLIPLSPLEVEYVNKLLHDHPHLSARLFSEGKQHWLMEVPDNKWLIDDLNAKRRQH